MPAKILDWHSRCSFVDAYRSVARGFDEIVNTLLKHDSMEV
jgi:hypothetical protein